MIVERTIPKMIRELPYNIIDIILGSYTSDEVIEFLKSIEKIDNEKIETIYSFEKTDKNSIRDRYIESILNYYGHKELKNLQNKRIWIEQRLKNAK